MGLSYTVGERVRSSSGCLNTAFYGSLSVWVVGRVFEMLGSRESMAMGEVARDYEVVVSGRVDVRAGG